MKISVQSKKGLETTLSIIIDKVVFKPFFDCTCTFINIGGQEETRTLKPCGTSS